MGSWQPRYPVFVPSKGRAKESITMRALAASEVPFRVVVEPSQVDAYQRWADRLLVLPEDGLKLLGARNWIRDFAESEGHARHWQLDDNIGGFRKLHRGERIPCPSGVALRACEDFTEQYANVGVSGLDYRMFVTRTSPPVVANVHVYSCSLINHAMPARWRLFYNDDTDLCLQALASGWATLQVKAFMANKLRTMVVKGGNTDDLYQGDGRLRMARALERMWPGVVQVKRRFGRPQHVVDWRSLAVPLKRAKDAPPIPDYGLKLTAVRSPKSSRMRRLLAEG